MCTSACARIPPTVSFRAATSTRWNRATASFAPMARALRRASATRSISRSGRRPSPASLRGIPPGARGVRAGTSSARPCRASTWGFPSTSMAAALTWCFRITRTSARKARRRAAARSRAIGCTPACSRLPTRRPARSRRCRNRSTTSCFCTRRSTSCVPRRCACSCCRRTIAARSCSATPAWPRPMRRSRASRTR